MDKLYFRVDANNVIATGHLMRCLSIADAARDYGIESVFITADEGSQVVLESRGYENVVLHSSWNDLDKEISQLSELIKQNQVNKLIVDSYYVTEKYLASLSKLTEVTYIDDLHMFDYPVANIICYANYYKKLYPILDSNINYYLGCEYVPLRKEFANKPQKKINENIENILILSGGSDQYHVIKQLLNKLSNKTCYNIVAVCGEYNEDYDELVQRYKNTNVKVLRNVSDIDKYMDWADLAISAGGSTLYELCACGTPTISYSIADNQLNNVMQFDEDGIIKYCGDVIKDSIIDDIVNSMSMFSSQKYRKYLSLRMQNLINGMGAKKIIKGFLLSKYIRRINSV